MDFEGKMREERIGRMEELYNLAMNRAEDLDYETLREVLEILSAYYSEGLWLSDYEADERGELPEDLKRGVLSQDGLFNLLEKFTL